MKNIFILIGAIVLLLIRCGSPESSENKNNSYKEFTDLNEPYDGFDIEGSSPIAITIADKVMTAMGGRKNWDETRILVWNFFGSRKLVWDKWTGDVRIENQKDDLKIILNITSGVGKVFKDGRVMTNPDSISFYLERGRRMWINDSYWLIMPFKLKDSGVTLLYDREDTTSQGEASHVLKLFFKNVGVTPDNAYEVWISQESYLVKQWAYYVNAQDTIPSFVRPWDNYEQKGKILLSSERGDRDLTEVDVWDIAPDEFFTAF